MRILVFFLSDEHPGPLISNYLAAFGKGSTLPEISDICRHMLGSMSFCWWTQWSQSQTACHLFNPACYPCNLLSDWHGSYVFAYLWSLMYPSHKRACVDWTSMHVLQNQCSKWVLLAVHAQISGTVDPTCYKPLRLSLRTLAQASAREVAVCPGFVDMQTLRYLEILDKWQNPQKFRRWFMKAVTNC